MKKSCFLISYKKYNSIAGYLESDVFKMAKEDGFDAVEPLLSHELAGANAIEDAKKIRERILSFDLDVSCLSYAYSFMQTDAKVAVDNLKKAVDITAALGSPFLHHTFQLALGYENGPEIYNKVHKHFVDIAREVAYYAGEKGIDCIYEDQGFYINTPERLASILSEIDLSNTGVCLDVGNALFYDTLPELWAGMFAKYIKHVHIKDYLKKSVENCPVKGWGVSVNGDYLRGTVVGHGVVNFEKIFSILLAHGYDGYFSLEYEGREEVLKGVKESVNNMQLFYDRAKEKLKFAGII